MANTTLAVFRKYVALALRFEDYDDAPANMQTDIDAWINNASKDIAAKTLPRELEAIATADITADQRHCTIPVTYMQVAHRNAISIASKPLRIVSKAEIDEMYGENTTASTPKAAAISGERIYLQPKPDATAAASDLDIDYFQVPATMTASTNTWDLELNELMYNNLDVQILRYNRDDQPMLVEARRAYDLAVADVAKRHTMERGLFEGGSAQVETWGTTDLGTFRESAAMKMGYPSYNAATPVHKSIIDIWINEVSLEITRKVRPRDLESSKDIAVVADDTSVALPTSPAFLRLSGDNAIYINSTAGKTVSMKDLELLRANNSTVDDDVPWAFAVWGKNLEFYPAADGSYTITLFYHAKPAVMSDSVMIWDLDDKFHPLMQEGLDLWRLRNAENTNVRELMAKEQIWYGKLRAEYQEERGAKGQKNRMRFIAPPWSDQ